MQLTTIKEASSSAAHLIGLPGCDWAVWRWVCLRSAGFPVDGVLKLAASPDLISAVDEVLRSVRAMELARQEVLDQINSALDFLKSSGRWDDKKTRKALLDVRARINAQKSVPQRLPEMVSSESTEKLRIAIQQVETTRLAFDEKFSTSWKQTTAAIREIVGSPAFREAITWQNRAVLQTALDPLLRNSPNGSSRSSKDKQHEELVASYWQRYCAKNDTIGFFGPVGWARFAPEVEYLTTRPHDQVVTSRTTYWEVWAIEALGEAILKKYDVQPWIAPILMPFLRVANRILHHPAFGPIRLTAGQALLLEACRGTDTAKQIAKNILYLPDAPFQTETEVYRALSQLATKGFVFWAFNIPIGAHPELSLRTALQRIGDPDIRQEALSLLNEFDSAKHAVETAVGDAERLNAALNNLEETFTRVTNHAATRNQGQIYAGRTLVYEDCQRDIEVRIGHHLLRSFSRPLSLLLFAGRWFTSRLAEAYRSKLNAIYSEIVRSIANDPVDGAVFWAQLTPLFADDAQQLVAPVQEEFQRKWEVILERKSDNKPLNYSYDELRELVLTEFASSGPGWISACYHSPDIMIAAANEEAIRQGDFFLVMGEMHMSKNTLEASLFVNQHPSQDELFDAVEHDLKGLNITPLEVKDNAGYRAKASLVPNSHLRLEYSLNSFISDRARSLPISSCVMEKHDGELIARTRDGRFCIKMLDLISTRLGNLAANCFKMMALRPHTPRISIDRLVIHRESWSFSLSDLPFAKCTSPAECFLEVRKWAQTHGMPRFVFFKATVEPKPIYLDFDSPVLVSNFVKTILRSERANSPRALIHLSEMLPTIDQTWLNDKYSRRYTSELRFVVVETPSS